MHLIYQLKNTTGDLHWELVRTLPCKLTVAQAEEMVKIKNPVHLFIKPEFDPILHGRLIEMTCAEFMDYMDRFYSVYAPCTASNIKLVEVKLLIDPASGIDGTTDLHDEINPIWYVDHAEVFLVYKVSDNC
jgi:hypothetical protein